MVRKYLLGALLFVTASVMAQVEGARTVFTGFNHNFSGLIHAQSWFDDVVSSPALSDMQTLRFNKVDPVTQVDFLNKQFSTTLFSQAKLMSVADVETIFSEDSSAHIAIIETGFNQCEQLTSAYQKVKARGSDKFNLKVLNQFRIYKQDHSLIFVISETPLEPQIRQLFTWLDASKHDTPCVG